MKNYLNWKLCLVFILKAVYHVKLPLGIPMLLPLSVIELLSEIFIYFACIMKAILLYNTTI